MSAVLAALQSPRRRTLLRLVWAQERAAGDLRAALPDITFGAVSQHLRRLEEAGLVRVRRAGRRRLYRAVPEAAGALRPWLEALWDEALADLTDLAERADSAP